MPSKCPAGAVLGLAMLVLRLSLACTVQFLAVVAPPLPSMQRVQSSAACCYPKSSSHAAGLGQCYASTVVLAKIQACMLVL